MQQIIPNLLIKTVGNHCGVIIFLGFFLGCNCYMVNQGNQGNTKFTNFECWKPYDNKQEEKEETYGLLWKLSSASGIQSR